MIICMFLFLILASQGEVIPDSLALGSLCLVEADKGFKQCRDMGCFAASVVEYLRRRLEDP